MSSILNFEDRTTCVLFGDGGGCVLLEATEDNNVGLIDHVLQMDGNGEQFLYQKAGGSLHPPSIETVTNREHFVIQEGQSVFKAAVKNMADVSYQIMERNNLCLLYTSQVDTEVMFDYSEITKNLSYPADALKWGIQGQVLVALLIGKCGNIHAAKILESDHKLLNKAALTVLLESNFTPAFRNMQPVTSWVRVPIDFKLRDKPSK